MFWECDGQHHGDVNGTVTAVSRRDLPIYLLPMCDAQHRRFNGV
jgi:hypothetical protein